MRNVRSVLPLRTAKAGNLILAALTVLLGISLLLHPDLGLTVLGTVAGWLLVTAGIFKMAGYFAKDLYRLAFQYDLFFGLLMTVLGVLILAKPAGLFRLLCTAAGLTFAADGLMRIKTATDARRFGLRKWWTVLLSGIFAAVCGILIMCFPAQSTETVLRLVGLGLAAEGLLNMVTVLMTVRIIRHQRPDTIDITVQP